MSVYFVFSSGVLEVLVHKVRLFKNHVEPASFTSVPMF